MEKKVLIGETRGIRERRKMEYDAIKNVASMICQKKIDGGTVTVLDMEGQEVLVYHPANHLCSNLINYGFSAPTLLVLGNKAFRIEEAVRYAHNSGLEAIAMENGGNVAFVNPSAGEDWGDEEYGVYERVLSCMGVGQLHFSEGIRTVYEWESEKIRGYHMMGSQSRIYVYANGSGADYIAKYYLKKAVDVVHGGMHDISFAGCTLENLSEMPNVRKNDIPVVSVNNREEWDEMLGKWCGSLLIAKEADFIKQYDQIIGKNMRMKGQLIDAPNYRKEGIIVKPESIMVRTSPDNSGIYADTEYHPLRYVTFYDQNLDVTQGKIPLLLCFHGGGDSAMCVATLSRWPEIGQENGFMTVSVEMHLTVTATEIIELIGHLKKEYAIDPERIYATGFSMGGVKTWDLFQEYPSVFAAVAPMDATTDVGLNLYDRKAQKLNKDTLLPVFYVGGEISPLPELPCQAEKCFNRMKYVLKVNGAKSAYNITFENQEMWQDPIWGVRGDYVSKILDGGYEGSVLTVHMFQSEDEHYYSAFAGASKQGHDIQPRNCREAWKFMSRFKRTADGTIESVGGPDEK